MRRILKAVLAALFVLTALFGCLLTAEASTYKEYTYNTAGEEVESPQTYVPVREIDGEAQTGLRLNAPTDIAHDAQGNLYILDAGNDRIVVLDAEYGLKMVLSELTADGEALSFAGCTGITVDAAGDIYLADKPNSRILRVAADGESARIIPFNPLPVVEETFIFRPTRLVVDSTGVIQVVSEGCYNGIITLDAQGNMLGYFGANKVQSTAQVLLSQFWKTIFTQEQQASMKQIIPVEYSSLSLDRQGFIYTCTAVTENSTYEIKKLNPSGENILRHQTQFPSVKLANGDYGDMRTAVINGKTEDTVFQDIHVDEEGFIFALDTQRGRIFQYDQDSTLVSIIGGIGEQKGTFAQPCAVSAFAGQVTVLDSAKNKLTVFSPTAYVQNIRTALLYNQQGEYIAAQPYWEQVLQSNGGYPPALSGIGKAYYKSGDYENALQYLAYAEDRENYDIVYAAYRKEFVAKNFGFFALGFVAVIALLFFWLYRVKKKGGEDETAIH